MKKITFTLFILSILSCKNNEKKINTDLSGVLSKSLVHDSISREYLVYIPNSYDAEIPTPVVMNFHGFGGLVNYYISEADMRSTADAENFILIYPQGSQMNGVAHWNSYPTGGNNKSNADDLGFVEKMIEQINTEYNIDNERIYAVGYSNGGMMAYGLSRYKSDLIAAVASVSGVMLDSGGTPNRPIPVLHLHGTSDGTIPYDGSGDYLSVQNVLEYWIDFNNNSEPPTVDSDANGGMTIEHYVYGSGDNNVTVEHYKFISGEHVWFNAIYKGKSTAVLIWDFFSKYDLNGSR